MIEVNDVGMMMPVIQLAVLRSAEYYDLPGFRFVD